ncbi:MAG: class I SAM-dependent methyltransferase [Chitinophagales bacterium]
MESSAKLHWEKIYETKSPAGLSWTEPIPRISLEIIHSLQLDPSASIIDIGGGDSRLADHLLEEGFENITVMDISGRALQRTKDRLGNRSARVKWIETDINTFSPNTSYDLWHDRAAFHFLTKEDQIRRYAEIASFFTKKFLVIGTFSETGPEKCSGLPVSRYSSTSLENVFGKNFEKMRCLTDDHMTPSGRKQNFQFCAFKRKVSAPAHG